MRQLGTVGPLPRYGPGGLAPLADGRDTCASASRTRSTVLPAGAASRFWLVRHVAARSGSMP